MINAKEMWGITVQAIKGRDRSDEKRCEKIVKEMRKEAKRRGCYYFVDKHRLSNHIIHMLEDAGYEVVPYSADYAKISWKMKEDPYE